MVGTFRNRRSRSIRCNRKSGVFCFGHYRCCLGPVESKGAAVVEPLAEAYVRKQIELIERRKLNKLMVDVREANAKVAPLIKKFRERHKERMRQDGPDGFKMVME